jgi:hypothetical protein
MARVKRELADARQELKELKRRQALSLSGSQAERQVETDIAAKEGLYDTLTQELEEADRRVDSERLKRTRIVAPPVAPEKPVRSRKLLIGSALTAALLLAALLVLFLEWQDPALHRLAEVARALPEWPILVIPEAAANQEVGELVRRSLVPVKEALLQILEKRGSAVVQIAGPAAGGGKTIVLEALASDLSPRWRSEIVSQNSTAAAGLRPEAGRSLEKQVAEWRQNAPLLFVALDSGFSGLPGAAWLAGADMTLVLLAAGRDSQSSLAFARNTLKAAPPEQKIFLLLNRFQDPLPAWFRFS